MANRHIICTDCGDTKWICQKQWRNKIEEFGSPTWVKRKYRCTKCIRLEREDPQTYYANYGKKTKQMRKEIREIYKTFLSTRDLKSLHVEIDKVLSKNGVDLKKVDYIITPDGAHMTHIVIRGVPVMGSITLSVYTPRGKTH